MRLFAVAACALAAALPASADEAPQPFVVVIGREADPTTLRLRAELESIGFDVVVVADAVRVPRASAAAVLTIDGLGRISVRLGNDARRPPDALVEPDRGASAEVAAVQIAERVRTVLDPIVPRPEPRRAGDPPASSPHVRRPDELQPTIAPPVMPPAPGRADRVPEAEVERIARTWMDPTVRAVVAEDDDQTPAPSRGDATERLGVGLGAGALFSAGGPGLDATLAGFYEPRKWLRVELFVTAPLQPIVVADAEGSAALHAGLLGARAALATELHPRLVGFTGLGVAGVWLRTEGQAEGAFTGVTDDAFTAALLLDAGLRVRIGEHLALVPRGAVGLALAPVEVLFAGREVGTWGLPLGAAGVDVEAAWSLGD